MYTYGSDDGASAAARGCVAAALRVRACTLLLALPLLAACAAPTGGAQRARCLDATAPSGTRVLVFSRTEGYRHESIEAGVSAVRGLGERYGFTIDHREETGAFQTDSLSRYSAVVFLNTTGDVLDDAEQTALESYIRGGGGFAGVHSATDTEYDWPWYGQLVGAYFRSHPRIQQATVNVATADHLSTRCLPRSWVRTDEWYNFRALPAATVTILATLDERTYEGGAMGTSHPIAWHHHFDGGRAWYTGMGHTTTSYADTLFLQHLAGGILWAASVER
jgi:type 1 glutamine amidotransferase